MIAPYATGARRDGRPAAPRRATSRGSPTLGARGRYGFYEALDYTPSRLPEGEQRRDRARLHGPPPGHDHRRASPTRCTTARCARASTPSRWSRRPSCCCRSARRATSRSPTRAPRRCKAAATVRELDRRRRCAASARRTTRAPRTHLLSNGRYAVMLTAAGSGYSRWRDLAVTRWREDATRDDWGSLHLPARRRRAARSGPPATSRAASSPTATRSMFTEDRAEFVAPRRHAHHDARGAWSRRRTTPRSAASRSSNGGSRAREIELTSYAELVLAPPAADAAHPAFSKLFVADRVSRRGRRAARDAAARARPTSPRSGPRISPWSKARASATPRSRPTARASSAAAASVRDADRGGRRPAALEHRRARCSTRSSPAPPRARSRRARTARVAFWTLVAPSRAKLLDLVDKHHDSQRVRARGHAGLDPGAGAARATSASSPSEAQPVPAPRRPRRSTPTRAAAVVRRDRAAAPAPQSGAVAARHLRRPADRAAAHRRRRGPRPRPPAAARPRVLAHEAARGRSRDPQRARRRPTSRTCRSRSRPLVRTSQSRPQRRRGARAGLGLRAARRPDARPRRAACFCRSRASVLVGRRGTLARAARSARRRAAPTPPPRRAPSAAPGASAVARRDRRSSSSTASAASPRTAAST